MNRTYRTSVTNLKLNKEQYSIIDTMSYRTKALYNTSLYEINQYYDSYKNGTRYTYKDNKGNTKDKGSYIGFVDLDKKIKNTIDNQGNIVYKSLPSSLAQQTIKKLDKNYSSFFKLLSMKGNKSYDKPIDSPKYQRKYSRKELIYTKSKTSQSFICKEGFLYFTVSKDLHKGRLKLTKLPKYIDFNTIKYIEIVPKLNRYEMHITYEIQEKEVNIEAKNFYSVDLGMNNLCTITSNKHRPIIMNGRPIKSINQKYNKRIAKEKSKLNKGIYTSKKIKDLYNTRGYKLNNEIHKITDFIIKSIEKNDIDHIVIGYNKEWKTNIKLGKKTNQNFVQIPFSKILNQLEYKCKELGIEVHLQEESYTSKCSYIDNEEVKRHKTYKGNRNKRGLFSSKEGIYINADVNGSLNIYRKFISKIQDKEVYDVLSVPIDTGLVMNPIKISLRTQMSLDEVNKLLLLI